MKEGEDTVQSLRVRYILIKVCFRIHFLRKTWIESAVKDQQGLALEDPLKSWMELFFLEEVTVFVMFTSNIVMFIIYIAATR